MGANGLTHFSPVLRFIQKPVIWFALQIKWLVAIWNAVLGRNRLRTLIIWDKVFKNGPSKICGKQPLKNFTWSILECFAANVHQLTPRKLCFLLFVFKKYFHYPNFTEVTRSKRFCVTLLHNYNNIIQNIH